MYYNFSKYIIPLIIFAALGAAFGVLFTLKSKENRGAKILFSIYSFSLFSQTLIPPEFTKGYFTHFAFHMPKKSQINLNPKLVLTVTERWYIHNAELFLFNFMGNIVFFIPLGFLLPVIFKKLKWRTVFVGIGVSVLIEFLQLFIDRKTDICDVLFNTVGIIIGYIVFLIYNKLKTK